MFDIPVWTQVVLYKIGERPLDGVSSGDLINRSSIIMLDDVGSNFL